MKNRLFIPHVNIFCLEMRLRRALFACETLSVNAFPVKQTKGLYAIITETRQIVFLV